MVDLKTILQQYEIDRINSLDTLGNSSIYTAKNIATGEELALKVMETNTDWDHGQIEENYQKAMSYTHPNLMDYKAVYRAVEEDWVLNYVFMEKGTGTSLASVDRKQLSTEQKGQIAQDIIQGLDHLHAYGLVYQRLEPRHILLDKSEDTYQVRLINYYNPRPEDTDSISFQVMSYECLAPEQLEEDAELSVQTDIWSLGVSLYYLFTGQYPFGQLTMRYSNDRIEQRILARELPSLIENIPQPFQSIVKKCLKVDLMDRWEDCEEITHYYQNYKEQQAALAKTQEAVETSDKNSSSSPQGEKDPYPTRRYLRKPSKPIRWWHIVLAFSVAGALGYYISTLAA